MITIVPATPEHIEALALRVRKADIDELWDGYEITPAQALRLGLQVTDFPKTALLDGQVLAIFGVAPALHGGWAVPWMIASNLVLAHRREFLVQSRQAIRILADLYGPMANWVDARNHTAIVWLRWLGFRIEAPAPYGKHGKDFCRFSMKEV